MVMLDSARRKVPVPALARWLLALGIAATLDPHRDIVLACQDGGLHGSPRL
jgi:hypothetical protein